ncbi:hypothetical protein HPB47_013161, partial [Ixodes persulcatus]
MRSLEGSSAWIILPMKLCGGRFGGARALRSPRDEGSKVLPEAGPPLCSERTEIPASAPDSSPDSDKTALISFRASDSNNTRSTRSHAETARREIPASAPDSSPDTDKNALISFRASDSNNTRSTRSHAETARR